MTTRAERSWLETAVAMLSVVGIILFCICVVAPAWPSAKRGLELFLLLPVTGYLLLFYLAPLVCVVSEKKRRRGITLVFTLLTGPLAVLICVQGRAMPVVKCALSLPFVLWGLAAYHAWVPPKPAPPSNCCKHCEYDLTGNVSGVCPECGTPVPPSPSEKKECDDSARV